ncbi:AraC family transcriptional regulator [Clostridium sp. YIM B02569]|uniref:AraC family transcriptional regulator n=1 Tax=Clostridium sp. YIM B02569 TaxID=2911967 RepID=UPI001EEDF1A9|nr:AraC family transcriptional regulator [Clostridium sp. YIM B02569]
MKKGYFYEYLPEHIHIKKNYSNFATNSTFHLHNSFEIYLFLKGDVNYWVEKSVYPLKRGTLLIINNQEIHRVVNPSAKDYERLLIHFHPQFVELFNTDNTNLLSCFTNREKGQNNAILLSDRQMDIFISLVKKSSDNLHNKKYGSDVLSRNYLVELLVFINTLYQQNKDFLVQFTLSRRLYDILTFIESHLSEDLSLDKISHHFSMDKSYLGRLFKKETGSTIYNYILLKRISLAKQLLSEGKNVSETCSLSGFNDYSNFIRTFKKITGSSPSHYNTHI